MRKPGTRLASATFLDAGVRTAKTNVGINGGGGHKNL
jgi:hypothetical protein